MGLIECIGGGGLIEQSGTDIAVSVLECHTVRERGIVQVSMTVSLRM